MGVFTVAFILQIGVIFFSFGTEPVFAAACNKLSTGDMNDCPNTCRATNNWNSGYGATLNGAQVCCCTGSATGSGGGASSAGGAGNQLCTKQGAKYVCHNPVACASMGSPQDGYVCLQDVIGRLIKAMFGIIGSVALLMFVWGGFLWLTAAGEERRITQGWNTMTWAVIGMGVLFGAYVIADFILKAFLKSMN